MGLATLKQVLDQAQKEGYAVGQFNVFNVAMLKGALRAAEATRSPVILAYVGLFDGQTPTRHFTKLVMSMLEETSVPVVFHWDHAPDIDTIELALKNGFSGVMLDASSLPLTENIAMTREVVRRAKLYASSVESELGHIGFEETYDLTHYQYTDPGQAKNFVERTGVDALAVAIGNAHGVYTSDPEINLDILEKIRAEVEVPLVLHGSSGISDDDIRACSARGIVKFNIYTELCVAAREAVQLAIREDKHYFDLEEAQTAAVEQVAVSKMTLFGSIGKAK